MMAGVFTLTLRLDTPLLQGGPVSGTCDPSNRLRGPSVRGLVHTMARALIGPLLNGDPKSTREAEKRLLGWSGDEGEDAAGAPTFRVCDVSGALLADPTQYPNCPHKPPGYRDSSGRREDKGERLGHPAAEGIDMSAPLRTGNLRIPVMPEPDASRHRDLEFRLRPDLCFGRMSQGYAHFFPAFWGVVWTAFALGSLGQRSRRGYGSLTICAAEGAPQLDGYELPVFQMPPTAANLKSELCTGLDQARGAVQQWLNSEKLDGKSSSDEFFQIEEVWIGQEIRESFQSLGDGAMIKVMEWCSLNHSTNGYANQMGSEKPRRASPCWIRLYRTTNGFVPVITYSPRATGLNPMPSRRIVDGLIRTLNASAL